MCFFPANSKSLGWLITFLLWFITTLAIHIFKHKVLTRIRKFTTIFELCCSWRIIETPRSVPEKNVYTFFQKDVTTNTKKNHIYSILYYILHILWSLQESKIPKHSIDWDCIPLIILRQGAMQSIWLDQAQITYFEIILSFSKNFTSGFSEGAFIFGVPSFMFWL